MDNTTTNYKDLVLVGGGHAHALVIKMWAMKPVNGVRLTLVSPQSLTPYSGMLPGLIAGNYTYEQSHIDLARLCQYAGVRFIQESISGIDLSKKEVLFPKRHALAFDAISINTGITPGLNVVGANRETIPVKPITAFYPRWLALVSQLEQDLQPAPYQLAVVGGGAAGVELIFAFQQALANNPKITQQVQFHLVHKGSTVPEGYPSGLQKQVVRTLKLQGIQLHCDSSVKQVRGDGLVFDNQQILQTDSVFWCTQASAADWPQASGLATDPQGYIALNKFLQSTSHDFVFAAGDIAQQIDSPRPRAGVYAVRQAPTLFNNLRRWLLHQPLKPFRPQKSFLSLLVCGKQQAVGCRTGRVFPVIRGHWVWRWKRHIDLKFMNRFSELTLLKPMPALPVDSHISNNSEPKKPVLSPMRCGGCGAKVGASVLQRVMAKLNPVQTDGIVLGFQQPDDAAVIRIPKNQLLVQSVDVFRALLDDPYVLGKISVEHALSDLFAMNATPHSALAIVSIPYAAPALVERDLLQLMGGATDVLNAHQCALIGGHTSEAAELSVGFSVNGLISDQQLLQKTTPTSGHQLILTQPLGTGALFAAHNQLAAKGAWIDEAIEWMLTSNRAAADIFSQMQASACTDVTGFGLLGHLLEMLKPQQLQARINLSALPALPGAIEVMREGITSTLHPDNQRLKNAIGELTPWLADDKYPLLFDPQTSGGLLACVAKDNAELCLSKLRKAGYNQAVIIGDIGQQSFETDQLIQLV